MTSKSLKSFSLSANRAALALIVIAGLVFAVGCGGGGSASTNPGPTPSPANSASTQVRFGDAPADSVISFEVSVSALSLTPSGGGANVNVSVPANNRLELTHASGKFEPFVTGNLPQGTFSAANLTLVNSELTFLSSTGAAIHINGPATATIAVPLSPALNIGTSPLVLNIDVNVANSITLSGGTINGISFGPTSFNITAKAPGAQASQQDDDGEIEDVQGLVTAVNGSSFTMNVGQTGSSLTFATDSTTQFKDGLTTVASALNQVVTVEGFTRSDGSLFAKELEGLESQTGAELEGLITAISGTTLTVSAQDGIGSGMDNSKIGSDFSVNIAGLAASKFRVNLGNGFGGSNLPNATFPFDATTIHDGQRIEVDTNAAVPPANGSITVDKIKLQQQGISGSVSNLAANGSTFDLTMAADAALAVISGQTVVHVTTVSGTDSRVTVANGGSVRVRGLLFWNGTSFQMLARRIR
ncbi:MAG TPA: DUF5666 domain-containing protein [Candidatus Limnocylindrales bacterium]|nr:DUF5666 domain-containing protein [Candidatus Limnocylindrales bacterium]